MFEYTALSLHIFKIKNVQVVYVTKNTPDVCVET